MDAGAGAGASGATLDGGQLSRDGSLRDSAGRDLGRNDARRADQGVKLPPPGWPQRFGGVGDGGAHSAGVDATGNLYVVGRIHGNVSFGGPTLLGSDLEDIVVASFAPDGSHRWSKRFGGKRITRWYTSDGNDSAQSIAVRKSCNIYFTGSAQGPVDFGGGLLSAAVDTADVFLASLDASGGYRWARRLGASSFAGGADVALDASENVYLAGNFSGSGNFGGGTLTSAGDRDMVLASFTVLGTHRWSKRFGGAGFDAGLEMVLDGAENVYLAAEFNQSAVFGTTTFASAGGLDAVLASFTSLGTSRWAKRYGGAGSDSAWGLTFGTSGEIFLLGGFQQSIDVGRGLFTSAGGWDVFVLRYIP